MLRQSKMMLKKINMLLSIILTSQTIEAHKGSKLMFILLDGFRGDYLDRPDLPGFKRFLENGTRVKYTTVDFPSLSMPNYYTIMTGLHTESHGMVGNNMYDEKFDRYFLLSNDSTWYVPLWWNQAEPFWIQAEKQGKRVYMYYWMGCEVEISGTKPTFCQPYFHHNGTYPDFMDMEHALHSGLHLLESDSADVIGIYVENPDKNGHYFGPNSKELKNKLNQIDNVIGDLVDNITDRGISDDVTIMIFSDHGMTSISADKVVNLTDYLNVDDMKSILDAGAVVSVWPQHNKTDKIYDDLVRAKDEIGHFDVYRKNDIPEEWHYKNNYRVAPLTVVAHLGWMIIHPEDPKFPSSSNGPWGGNHGYYPNAKDMHGIFIASGPGIKKNVEINPVNAVDIYQLMCHMIDIKPSYHNGTWSHVAAMFVDTSSAKTCYSKVFTTLLSLHALLFVLCFM